MRRLHPETGLLLLGVVLFATFLFTNISHPLLWQDEGETVMFATRVVEYGYPKVHGERNVLYEFGSNVAEGVKEQSDAYIGTTWGHFYFAVPGVLAARGVVDPYAKTARLRLPFALAGAAGVAVWMLALTPVFRGDSRRARLFCALFLLLAVGSVSLLLHLREARYYPLMVLWTGGIAYVHLRHRVFGKLRGARYTIALTLLLVLVFHTFFAGYFFLALLLAAEGLVVAHRPGEGLVTSLRRALPDLAPVLFSALLVAPGAIYFETFGIAASFGGELGLSASGYLANLSLFLRHFAVYELLIPAVVCRLAVVAVDRSAARRGIVSPPTEGRRVAVLLTWFVAAYAAVTCVNPLVYERYFVVLSPAVLGVFLLDAFSLVEAIPRRVDASRRGVAAAVTVVVILALVGVTSGARIEAVRGRLHEISEPYRGPLDFVVAHLAETHARPERLVIATNYANHPLMYYLGSHVIVGTNLNNIVRERSLEPDVVILRRRWPRGRKELQAFLARGGYVRVTLPVQDLYFNNIPALSRAPSMPEVHRFVTPVAEGDEQLVIFEKAAEAPR